MVPTTRDFQGDPRDYDANNVPERLGVRKLITRVQLDEANGIAYLGQGTARISFSTLSDLICALEMLADTEIGSDFGWNGDGQYMDHEGRLVYPPAREFVRDELSRSSIPSFFIEKDSRQSRTLLLDEDDLRTQNPESCRVELNDVIDSLIKYLALHPEKMYELDPYKFEELVAALFRERGYEVVHTPRARDGGRDLLAFFKEPFGTILTIVECKKYGQHRRIGPALVRQLYGVVEKERASHGILVTTTLFTPGARDFALDLQYRLSLRDFEDLARWCKEYKSALNR